jgi:riboflavin kinase
VSKDALVEDIREDIRVAQRSLAREAYQKWKDDAWLRGEGVSENVDYGTEGQKDGVVISQMIN